MKMIEIMTQKIYPKLLIFIFFFSIISKTNCTKKFSKTNDLN